MLNVKIEEENYFKEKSKIQEITKQIYITSFFGAKNKQLLEENKITHILICAGELEEKFPKNFEYKKLKVQDNPNFNIQNLFQETFEWVDTAIENQGVILFHW